MTGSEGAGRDIASTAGKHIKKSVLELGGSDAFIVLRERRPAPRRGDGGEGAHREQRPVVHRRQALHRRGRGPRRFVRDFAAAMGALRVGDPMAAGHRRSGRWRWRPSATASPTRSHASVAAGARLLAGGQRPEGPGCFYPATVLAEVPTDAPAAREEVFGPVAAVFRVAGIDEAIALANASQFGLGAAAWTRDRGEADRLARELESGSVFINGMVASDPRFPFGGVKRSGYGRELGVYGLREFVNIKTVRTADLG